MLTDETEQHGHVASNENEALRRARSGKALEAPGRDLYSRYPTQQVVYSRHEALSDKRNAVIKDNKCMADAQCASSGRGLSHGNTIDEEGDAEKMVLASRDWRGHEAQSASVSFVS